MFAAANLARQLGLDPGTALRRGNAKFERRFRAIEALAGDQAQLEKLNLDEMEMLWQTVKKTESKKNKLEGTEVND